jgi:hypothetical protein
MSKKISSYDELLEEKARLQELLGLQKAAISGNLASIQEDVRPVTNGLLVVGRVLSKIGRRNRPTSPLLNVGLDIGVDMVLRRYILRKAGWFSRTFVPLIASTFLARFLNSEQEPEIIKKMKQFLSRQMNKDVPPDMSNAEAQHDEGKDA